MQAAHLTDPAVIVRDAISAIVWLQHCQRYSIDEHIVACELKIGQNFLQLAAEQKETLALLSSPSLIRISRVYARCSWVQSSASVEAHCKYCCRDLSPLFNGPCTPLGAHLMDAEVAPRLIEFYV